MDWINTFLTIIILTNLLLVMTASFGYNGEGRGAAYFVYLFNIAAIIWWLAATILFRIADATNIGFYTRNMYVSATFIASSFYYFSSMFPERHLVHKARVVQVVCANMLVVALILFGDSVVAGGKIAESRNSAILGKYFVLYAAYIMGYLTASFVALYGKYRREDNTVRKAQLFHMFLGYSVSGFLAFAADLFLPFFGHFEYLWVGPAATAIVAMLTAYAVMKHRLFSIKIIAIEFAVFALWVIAIVRISMYSGNIIEGSPLVNFLYLLSVILLGALLILSIKKEVIQKERTIELVGKLTHANLKLKEANELRLKFLGLATHQMASPLTAMKFYASFLKEDPEAASGKYGDIEGIADNFISVVRDFLDLSKIEEGAVEYKKEEIGIGDFIHEIAEARNQEAVLRGAGAQVIIQKTAHNSLCACGDREKLSQAIGNILDNSMRHYAKKENAELTERHVNIEVEDIEERREIAIKISDKANRMLPAVPQALLQKFSAGADAMEANVIGNGLGVYVAKQFIEGQGGRLVVEAFDSSCNFMIYLQRSNL
jgi:signal transduction histidine kinase